MDKLNIDVSAFNEEEITTLLLEAIEAANNKCMNYASKISQLEELNKSLELNHSKILIEKENLISRLRDQLKESRADVEQLKKDIVCIQETHSEIEQRNKNAIEDLNKKVSNGIRIINEKEELIVHKDTQNMQFRVHVLKNLIIHEIQYIKKLINTIKVNDSKEFVAYLTELSNCSESIYQEFKSVEELCLKLFEPEGAMSKVVTLLWWLNNDSTKDELSRKINGDKQLKLSLEQIVYVLSIFGYEIVVPSTSFGDNVRGYDLYENSKSCIKNIFPNIEISSPALCEVYKVAFNGNKGLCFYV